MHYRPLRALAQPLPSLTSRIVSWLPLPFWRPSPVHQMSVSHLFVFQHCYSSLAMRQTARRVTAEQQKKRSILIGLEPTTFLIDIEHYNHYTNQSFCTRHCGSICHVGTGQPTWPIVQTPNWLNRRSTAICPDGQQANLAFRPKFCLDQQPGSIGIIRGPVGGDTMSIITYRIFRHQTILKI